MTALAADRHNQSTIETKSRAFDTIAASVAIWHGAMISMDSSGHCRPARADTTDKVLGVSMRQIASQAAAGAPADGGKVLVESDSIHRLGNSAAADAITNAHVGRDCYVVDDQTVALTSGAGTRPRAGRIHKVDSTGVYVDFGAEPNRICVVGPLIIADVSTASDSPIGAVPFAGKVVEFYTVLQAAITVADSIVTPKIGATPMTGGAVTVAFTGSAAGDIDRANPSAANAVTPASKLVASSDGGSTTAAALHCYFVIEAD